MSEEWRKIGAVTDRRFGQEGTSADFLGGTGCSAWVRPCIRKTLFCSVSARVKFQDQILGSGSGYGFSAWAGFMNRIHGTPFCHFHFSK